MSIAQNAAERARPGRAAVAGPRWAGSLPLALAVICQVFSATAVRAEGSNDGPERFHEVNGWRGTLVATARANPESMGVHDEMMRKAGKDTRWSFDFHAFVSVDFLLEEYESDPSIWRGRVTGSEYSSGYHYFIHVPEQHANDPGWKGYVENGWDYTANGALDFSSDPRVELQFHRERGWSVRMASGRLPTEARSLTFIHVPTKAEQNPDHDLIIGPDSTWREQVMVTALGMGSTENHPYPKTAFVLLGSNDQKKGSFPLIFGNMGVTPEVLWDYTVYLEPTSLDELKLEIEEPADYKTWRPETTPQCDAGKPLAVTAKVVRAKGGPPTSRVEKFVWELIDTSQEPGVAMNFPLEAKDQRFDLDLDAEGEFFLLEKKNQRMTRAVRSGFSDTVKVVPYDWGGWATLQVTAYMSDGRQVRGKLKGRSELGLRVPKRDKDSHIADVWKNASGVSGADRDDDEKIEGQQDNGDGYTLYEEYRGWVEKGRHVEGDPKDKDFFVLNLIGGDAEPGIDLFAGVSQLAVHSKLRPEEMSETTRLMNGNHREGAHRVDQHGVWVKTFASKSALGDDGAMTVMTDKGVAGRPGTTKGVGILGRDNTESAFNKPFNLAPEDSIFAFDRAIAHELLHSVGVEHHGTGDYRLIVGYASTRNPMNKLGRPYYGTSPDKPVDLRTEEGEDVAQRAIPEYEKFRAFAEAAILDRCLQEGADYIKRNGVGYGGYQTPQDYADRQIELILVFCFMHLDGNVGVEHGEHSGAEDCLMRYYFATFYESKQAPAMGTKMFYEVTPGSERIGVQICRDGKGTGVNEAGHKPQSRYGAAAGDAGNCFGQICPNDAIPPRKVK